ncbi:SMS, partial [Cordylochernes scorpioides]
PFLFLHVLTVVLTVQKLEDIRKNLVKIFQTKIEKTPAFKHATEVPIYFNNSEERIMEYDFNKIIFEAESPYQNIKILDSPTLGKCLLLDDLQNLGECDLSYTHALMKYQENSYKDKEILILGGGDGGLLYELLKEDPKFVTLIDISFYNLFIMTIEVIEACRKHMRSVCGSSMDTFTSHQHEIIVDDCFKKMDVFIQEGRKFDHIFNDLTDIPIHKEKDKGADDTWALIKKILNTCLPMLKPGGSYLNHAIGITCKDSLAKYEELLSNLPVKVTYSQHSAYVPSFIETWTFYEVRKVEESNETQ